MAFSNFRMRVLILVAYLLVALWPALPLGEGSEQSLVDHAQMMGTAGHLAHMPATGNPDNDAQRLLCQQHCLFAAAALPASNRGAEAVARATDVEVRIDLLAASLAIPPPGRPPKIAVI